MISMDWVKDYIDLENEDLKELAVKITKAGVNIESVNTNHIDNLVIGEVTKVDLHPDSDHLHVCMVNIGSETLQIVCGAPNVREGLKVIVAKIGAKLPGDFEIKKGKIRGIESCGMLCALFELGLEEKTEENYNKGIAELENCAPVGSDPLKYLGIDDTIYELDIHKHRNNDCYYHIGFAYEIGAILGKKVTLPEIKFDVIDENINDYFKLDVQTDACPFYTARMVKDVKVGPSPDFIKKRLQAAGMRSINNVVDISNYVMLEFGQPLHFFDKDKLGDEIVVRMAHDNECIKTLDGKDRFLSNNDIVITDSCKSVCIAGVMGGENTEVDENTNTILIESAIFNAINIRNTANSLNLKSEASIRYGKGLNYEYTLMAINRACYLLEKYANAKILDGIVIHDTLDKSEKHVTFKADEVNKMLGITITDDDMKVELEKLGFECTYKDGSFDCIIPNRRLDIDPYVNDIAEEIGRLYGYHNLVSTLPTAKVKRGVYVGDVKYRKLISKHLRALSLNEVKTYTLVNPSMKDLFKYDGRDNVILPNPLSMDKSVIRTTILPSLLNTYNYNKARNVKNVNIYEISKTYDKDYNEESKVAVLMSGEYITSSWSNSTLNVDFYLIKGILENLLDYMGFKNRYDFERLDNKDFHPGMSAKVLLDREEIGVIGRIHPNLCKDSVYVFEISMNKLMKETKPLKFKEALKYPEIVKDVAFILNKDIESKEVESIIKKSGGRLLTDINVFDVYTKDKVNNNEKSIAYSLTFSDENRTLTEEEVMNIFNKIISDVESKLNAKVRNGE